MAEADGFATARDVTIEPEGMGGRLAVPPAARGIVLFAHGSGSGRFSPRNNQVARALEREGFATLLLDLLTAEEARDRRNVFDIALLAGRLSRATRFVREEAGTGRLPVGYFGASTGAGAALLAAAGDPSVAAVVSRGGRPELAGEALERVKAPTLLLVGSLDTPVIALNEEAMARMAAPVELVIVPGASHLFEEPGTLDAVVRHAAAFFGAHMPAPPREE